MLLVSRRMRRSEVRIFAHLCLEKNPSRNVAKWCGYQFQIIVCLHLYEETGETTTNINEMPLAIATSLRCLNCVHDGDWYPPNRRLFGGNPPHELFVRCSACRLCLERRKEMKSAIQLYFAEFCYFSRCCDCYFIISRLLLWPCQWFFHYGTIYKRFGRPFNGAQQQTVIISWQWSVSAIIEEWQPMVSRGKVLLQVDDWYLSDLMCSVQGNCLDSFIDYGISKRWMKKWIKLCCLNFICPLFNCSWWSDRWVFGRWDHLIAQLLLAGDCWRIGFHFEK